MLFRSRAAHARSVRLIARLFQPVKQCRKIRDGDLSITLSEDGIITFSNTAAALSEVEVGRLFDRFYTVENAKNATGLGLSLHGHWWSRCTGRWMPLMKRGGLSSGGRFSLFFYKTDQK